MPSPLPRHSGWAYYFAHFPSRISLPRKGCRVGLRIVLFEACSAFTRVTACTLALSPIRDTLIEGFSHFVTSMTAPIASGRSVGRVGFAPTGKAPPCHGAHPKRTPVSNLGMIQNTALNSASDKAAPLTCSIDVTFNNSERFISFNAGRRCGHGRVRAWGCTTSRQHSEVKDVRQAHHRLCTRPLG